MKETFDRRIDACSKEMGSILESLEVIECQLRQIVQCSKNGMNSAAMKALLADVTKTDEVIRKYNQELLALVREGILNSQTAAENPSIASLQDSDPLES